MKPNNKPWIDNEALNATENRSKHYRKVKQSGNESGKDNFEHARLLLKNTISENFTLKRKM